METHMVWCDRVSGSSDACMQRCICGTSWATMFSGLDRYIYMCRGPIVIVVYGFAVVPSYWHICVLSCPTVHHRLDVRAYDISDTGRTYGQNVCLGNAEKKENSIWDTYLVDTGQPKLVFSKFEKNYYFKVSDFF
jgi:hypothetical protein